MKVWHVPPWKPRMTQSACLGWCFLATMVIMSVLIFMTYALGQDHPFPFKTWEQINKGTVAWPLDGEVEVRYCPGHDTTVAKAHYKSGAGSVWQVYTDKKVFTAGYYVPGVDAPMEIATGRIENGNVVVGSHEPYDPAKHTPCGPFQQKSASGELGGC